MSRGTVVVTGAAGALGAAAADALTADGWQVVGIDRITPAHDVPGSHHVVDLAADDAEQQVAEALEGRDDVRHLVGIAGGALPGEPEGRDDPLAVDVALFEASLRANLVTQYVALRAVLPALRRSDGDRSITLTSSFNARSAQGMPAYSAAKAGLEGVMHGLVVPLGREGVRINVVAPGTVRTPRTERLWGGVEGHFERLEAGTALGRLAVPEDVAGAYVALCSHLRHVTGQVLVVDGGQTVVHR